MAQEGFADFIKKSFRRGEIRDRKYLDKVFTKKGKKAADNAISKLIGSGRELDGVSKIGLLGWGAGIMFDVPRYMEQGDGFAKALGKSVVKDSMFMAMPYLLPIGMAGDIAQAYPDMKLAKEAQRSADLSFNTLGGGYTDTQANHAARARAMEAIKRSRQPSLGGEARRYHR